MLPSKIQALFQDEDYCRKLQTRNRLCKFIFEVVFSIHTHLQKLSQEEEYILERLVFEKFREIENTIFSLGCSFDANEGPLLLMYRSAVQFLLEKYEFVREELKKTESLADFDEELINWKENPPYLAYDSIYHSDEELKRPQNVPSHHTWWW